MNEPQDPVDVVGLMCRQNWNLTKNNRIPISFGRDVRGVGGDAVYAVIANSSDKKMLLFTCVCLLRHSFAWEISKIIRLECKQCNGRI